MCFFGADGDSRLTAAIRTLVQTPEVDRNVLDRLYAILTTLDAKANGLLRLNSLFLTVLVFLLGWSQSPNTSFPPQLRDYIGVAIFDVVLLMASSLACLWIVRVSWRFLGSTNQSGTLDIAKELASLGKVAENRTHYYWVAWWGTFVAYLLPALWWLHLWLR